MSNQSIEIDTVYADENGNYELPVEQHYESAFMNNLHAASSYEEFMMLTDISDDDYDYSYFGFQTRDELMLFVKDYINLREKDVKSLAEHRVHYNLKE